MRVRGFLIGATAGRTTLNGEGLQHEDGESPLIASGYPSIRAYDPAFAYEVAAIAREGIRRFFGAPPNADEIFYLTLYNEDVAMPPRPEGVTDEQILGGLYLFRSQVAEGRPSVDLLGSGPILFETLKAQEILADRYGVEADLWSVTSFVELAREAERVEEWNRLHPAEEPRLPRVTELLGSHRRPVIAATDYVKALPRLISSWLPQGMTALGTDGFGRSDTRPVLRRFFRNDAPAIVMAALAALARVGKISPARAQEAIRDFGEDPNSSPPLFLTR
jgi:pyruvate dehydrogenase E1 component